MAAVLLRMGDGQRLRQGVVCGLDPRGVVVPRPPPCACVGQRRRPDDLHLRAIGARMGYIHGERGSSLQTASEFSEPALWHGRSCGCAPVQRPHYRHAGTQCEPCEERDAARCGDVVPGRHDERSGRRVRAAGNEPVRWGRSLVALAPHHRRCEVHADHLPREGTALTREAAGRGEDHPCRVRYHRFDGGRERFELCQRPCGVRRSVSGRDDRAGAAHGRGPVEHAAFADVRARPRCVLAGL